MLAAVLNGAVFMLHFRVAAFYIPLLCVSVIWELVQAHKSRQLCRVALATAAIGAVTLFVALPALFGAAQVFLDRAVEQASTGTSGETAAIVAETTELYYEFPSRTVSDLAARTWLLALTGLAAIVGLAKTNRLVLFSVLWIIALILLGNTYRLGIPTLIFTNMGAVLIMLYLPFGVILGATEEVVLGLQPVAAWKEKRGQVAIVMVLSVGFVFSHVRASDIEPFRYFVTAKDVTAVQWIGENTPADALFAVNTFFWLPCAPHGTDEGYWIPYFTGWQTTAGAMLLWEGVEGYPQQIVELSRAEEQLETDVNAISRLQTLGVDYVYIGKTGDFSGPGLRAEPLLALPQVKLLYQEGPVSILQISSPQ